MQQISQNNKQYQAPRMTKDTVINNIIECAEIAYKFATNNWIYSSMFLYITLRQGIKKLNEQVPPIL